MTGTIQDYQGQLCIVDDWQTAYNEPVAYRLYWPTGVKTSEYPHLVGQRVTNGFFSGTYRVEAGPDAGLVIALLHREKTKSIYCEEQKVRKPKRAKRWLHGGWKFY